VDLLLLDLLLADMRLVDLLLTDLLLTRVRRSYCIRFEANISEYEANIYSLQSE
jgi:hypothetical protein